MQERNPMTIYTPILKSGDGSLVLVRTPNLPPRCAAVETGPGHWDRTCRTAEVLQAAAERRAVGR